MNELLDCQQVHKIYQEGGVQTQVLKGVNLTLKAGELAAIVGTSGSGKSTLLHILGALDTASQGEVFLLGQALSQLNRNQQAVIRNRHLGFIYQFHHLLSDFSALDNVAMPLRIAGQNGAKAQRNAKQWLELVGLGHRVNHRPAELSGGERQRVAIARALVNNPDLVLADEPTGNLDYQTALAIYDLMRQLNRESGTAFLIVTHDSELANKMDRQWCMQDGLLTMDGRN